MKRKVALNKLGKHKTIRIFFLLFLVVSNTFAWFIYATKIDGSVNVHVKAWNIMFEANENEVYDIVNLNVDSVYPGMDDYSYDIVARNLSEVSASMSYKILEANVLGTQYITVEGRAERGESPSTDDLTSLQLESKLANDYPFEISIDVSSEIINEENGEEQFTLGVVWPYESGDDEEDTYWGIMAYNYKESNPSAASITLKVKISITQSLSQSSGSSVNPGSGSD